MRGHSVGGDLMASDYPDQTPGQGFDPNDPTDVACQSCHTASALPGSIHSERHLETIPMTGLILGDKGGGMRFYGEYERSTTGSLGCGR